LPRAKPTGSSPDFSCFFCQLAPTMPIASNRSPLVFPTGWHTYMLICIDGSCYVGLAYDLTQGHPRPFLRQGPNLHKNYKITRPDPGPPAPRMPKSASTPTPTPSSASTSPALFTLSLEGPRRSGPSDPCGFLRADSKGVAISVVGQFEFSGS